MVPSKFDYLVIISRDTANEPFAIGSYVSSVYYDPYDQCQGTPGDSGACGPTSDGIYLYAYLSSAVHGAAAAMCNNDPKSNWSRPEEITTISFLAYSRCAGIYDLCGFNYAKHIFR